MRVCVERFTNIGMSKLFLNDFNIELVYQNNKKTLTEPFDDLVSVDVRAEEAIN